MRKRELIVLQYCSNKCDFEAVRPDKAKEGLEIDIQEETWSWGSYKSIPIGKGRTFQEYARGVIGVYDPRKIIHLNDMAWTTGRIASENSSRGFHQD